MRQSRLFPGATLGAALLLILLAAAAEAVELTFELPDNAKECFFQEIDKNTTATLEFQVNFAALFHFNNNCVK
jgi:emp24/gp25L/p24 family/GOLD